MQLLRVKVNSRRLLISDREKILSDLDRCQVIPSIVLVTAWTNQSASFSTSSDLIKDLIRRGCTYFVCAGKFAEELHDTIDDIISLEKRDKYFATTFHEDESPEDVVNFLVHTATISAPIECTVVALLDKECHEDRYFEELLLQEC